MNKEVARAHADTLLEWSEQWKRSGGSGAEEMSFLLARASRLAAGVATDSPVILDPIVPLEPVVDEPKDG